jgi:hypothetical protein
MYTQLKDPGTMEALNEAYQFAKVHGKLTAMCDKLDQHIIVMRDDMVNDYNNIIGTILDDIDSGTKQIRQSTDLKECLDLVDRMIKHYEYLSGFDMFWHFRSQKSLDQLETILYDMYDIVD